jgi:hypothetical protein
VADTPFAQMMKDTVLSSHRLEFSSKRKAVALSFPLTGDESSRQTAKSDFSTVVMNASLMGLAAITSSRVYDIVSKQFLYVSYPVDEKGTFAQLSRFPVVRTLAQFTSSGASCIIAWKIAFNFKCDIFCPSANIKGTLYTCPCLIATR